MADFLTDKGTSPFFLAQEVFKGWYVWTVVPVQLRKPYMEALDKASTGHDIAAFSAFIGQLIREQTHTPVKRPT